MSRRDLAWRTGGVALMASALAASIAKDGDPGRAAALSLCAFLLAIGGLVLVVQGDRVRRALRIERSRHRYLPGALGSRRHARRADGLRPN